MLQSASKQSFKAVGAIYALLILFSLQHFAMEICNSGLLAGNAGAWIELFSIVSFTSSQVLTYNLDRGIRSNPCMPLRGTSAKKQMYTPSSARLAWFILKVPCNDSLHQIYSLMILVQLVHFFPHKSTFCICYVFSDPLKVEWWNCERNRRCKRSCNDEPATRGLLNISAPINIIPLLWAANSSNKQVRLWCGQPNLYPGSKSRWFLVGSFRPPVLTKLLVTSLSIKVQEVRTITLNLACRIRALLPPIVNCCKKLRGFNAAYGGTTSHEYFEVQEGSQLLSRSADFQFHLVRFWYH